MAARSLISRLYPLASRSSSSLNRLRPLAAAAADAIARRLISNPAGSGGIRSLSTRPTVSSLNDPSPNFSNRPPKETILLDGCDFEHWLVVVDPPEPQLTRDEIIDSYIKTLAKVVGSEDEARMKIYSVSTKHYFAFGALVPEEVSHKIKELPKVRWVLPDSYLDVRNKDYGGEPFINGQAVPYDPKYHEEWVRNNARANDRSRRDRPRNSDRSRNFERRRENLQQNQNFPRDAPPMPNDNYQRNANMPPPQNTGPPNPDVNPAPMQNESYTRNPNMPAPQDARPPNMDYNAVPPIRNVPLPSPPPPNQGYAGQMPNPSYPGGNQGYPGGPPQYQGPNQGYQRGNPGGVMPGGPNQGYQGGNPGGAMPGGPNQGYQGGNPGGAMPGGPNYHGSNPGHQGGGGPAYQGTYQNGNFGNPGYQGGNPPNYQPGGYQGPPTSGPVYQGRDVQGRDS